MSRGRRVGLLLLGALAFGLLAAWAKDPAGNGRDALFQARSDIGNLSAPWLLVAFAAGAQFRRLRTGALAGLVATVVALTGFYLFNTLVEDLGGHGLLGDLRLEFRGNLIWFKGGVVTGPLFGALGAWWHHRRTLGASVVAGALLIGEPLVAASHVVPWWGLTPQSGAIPLAVYGVEFALGVVLLARRASSSST